MPSENPEKKCKLIKFKWGVDDWIALGLIGFGVFIPGINSLLNSLPAFRSLFSDIRGELIGLGIGVILINNAAEHMKQVTEEKRKSISMAGSSDNNLAREGIENLRKQGWLNDGSMSGYRYENANWKGLEIREAKLSSTDLQFADLSNSNLIDVDLSGSSLRNADLGGTLLSNVNLKGADLSNVRLEDSNLKNIIYDENTKWPLNFDPKEKLEGGIFKIDFHDNEEDNISLFNSDIDEDLKNGKIKLESYEDNEEDDEG